jgi:hypothetical protein
MFSVPRPASQRKRPFHAQKHSLHALNIKITNYLATIKNYEKKFSFADINLIFVIRVDKQIMIFS